MNSAQTGTEFVDPVSQEVGLRLPQFMSHLVQPLQSEVALVLCLRRARIAMLSSLYETTLVLGTSLPVYSQCCEIATASGC